MIENKITEYIQHRTHCYTAICMVFFNHQK